MGGGFVGSVGMRRGVMRSVVVGVAGAVLLGACAHVPSADPEDVEIRDQWAAKVPAEFREKTRADADRHTGWGEKRKIEYEVAEYQHYVKNEDRKARATTRKSSSTRPATTRATTRRTRARANED